MARKSCNPNKISKGDKVALSVSFLRSTGQSHSEAARWRGVVVSIDDLGGCFLATMACGKTVNIANLARVGSIAFAAC
jgi:hypothetical protein